MPRYRDAKDNDKYQEQYWDSQGDACPEGAESEVRNVSFGQIIKERDSILGASYKNFKKGSSTIGFAFLWR